MVLNEIFAHTKEITSRPGYSKHWKFQLLTTKAFGPKLFSTIGAHGFTNRKNSGLVNRAAMKNCDRSIGQILFSSLQTGSELLISRR